MCDNLCLVQDKEPGKYSYFCFSESKIIDSPRKCSDGHECPNYKDIDWQKLFESQIIPTEIKRDVD